MNDFKLCYIENNRAWFTTAKLSKQTGDDWDDAPRSCNAGLPYECHVPEGDDGYYELMDFYFMSGCLEEAPDDISVDRINRGNCAWLLVDRWSDLPEAEPIMAGVSIETFDRLIRNAGGQVYYPVGYEQYVKSVSSDDID